MILVGDLVKFCWWSNYKAPSITPDENGHITWHEIIPGERGVIIEIIDEETVIVLFSSVDSLLRLNRSMIETV